MEIVKDIEWRHIYWVRGDTPRGSSNSSTVKDPPCAGWQHAVVIKGQKRSTIFCPFSMTSYSVPNSCGELECSKPPRDNVTAAEVAARIQNQWAECQQRGWAKDYDTAALVLRRLGAEVPTQLLKGGEEDTRKKGGKEVEDALKKPVKRSGKRGKFLQWFLEGEGSRSVREAMAEFGMSRSNALSYLYMLQKDHGIGYELVGDMAVVSLPSCDSPFDDGYIVGALDVIVTSENDDSWLDGDKSLNTEDNDNDDWLG